MSIVRMRVDDNQRDSSRNYKAASTPRVRGDERRGEKKFSRGARAQQTSSLREGTSFINGERGVNGCASGGGGWDDGIPGSHSTECSACSLANGGGGAGGRTGISEGPTSRRTGRNAEFNTPSVPRGVAPVSDVPDRISPQRIRPESPGRPAAAPASFTRALVCASSSYLSPCDYGPINDVSIFLNFSKRELLSCLFFFLFFLYRCMGRF